MIRVPRADSFTENPGYKEYQHELLSKGITTSAFDVVSRLDTLGQAASISATKLYLPRTDISEAGIYIFSAHLVTTRAGTGGTVLVTLTWNNGSASTSVSSGTANLSVLGSEASLVQALYSVAGQNISYSTTVAGAAGSPLYALRLRLASLG